VTIMIPRRSLRPCLRHDEIALPDNAGPFPFASSTVPTIHVHFPPTPNLASTHLTHSPHTYDRAPIMVRPNECALPERGGRMYTPGPEHRTRRKPHTPGPGPNASQPPLLGNFFTARDAAPSAPFPIPALVQDVSSSESDESDMATTPPDMPAQFPHSTPSFKKPTDPNAYAFLPHPHVASRPSFASYQTAPPPDYQRGRERKRPSRRPTTQRQSGFGQDELEGCLGGF